MARRRRSMESQLLWGAVLAAVLVGLYRMYYPAPGLDATGTPLQGLRMYRGVG